MIYRSIIITFSALLLLSAVVMMLPTDPNLGPLENIHGIPYPQVSDRWHITEEMAHSDVYITKPVFAQTLTLTITFAPRDLEKLAVGIRENSFWLSYDKQTIYDKKALPLTKGESEGVVTLTIPLTDKLSDRDGSVDLMFFASPRRSPATRGVGGPEPIWWELVSLDTRTAPALPTWPQTKDYVRSIISREKVL